MVGGVGCEKATAFIPGAESVADEPRGRLARSVEVGSVAGLIPPAERENRVEALGQADKRVLVATDCLSEGINLQHPVSYTHLRAHETVLEFVCRLLLEKKKTTY